MQRPLAAQPLRFFGTPLSLPDWPALDGGRVFRAPVDTTFSVYDKAQLSCAPGSEYPNLRCFTAVRAVRVAGVFAAKHRPWYPEVLARIPVPEVLAMFGENRGTAVAGMLHREGVLTDNEAADASGVTLRKAFGLARKWLHYSAEGDILGFRCPHTTISGKGSFDFVIPGSVRLVGVNADAMPWPVPAT